MIRPATFVCTLLALGSGLYLYQSKHRAQLLDREIARVVKDTGTANERINVLKAESQILNEPERLQGLSQHYLQIRPMSPGQNVTMAELGAHLPAALPADGLAPATNETASAPAALLGTPVVVAMLGSARPSSRPAPAAPVSAVVVPAAAAPPPPHPVPKRAADASPHAGPSLAPAPPIASAVAAPLAPAAPVMPRSALVQRVMASVPAPVAASSAPIAFPAAPPVTSALGMAARSSLLPPPVPVH